MIKGIGFKCCSLTVSGSSRPGPKFEIHQE